MTAKLMLAARTCAFALCGRLFVPASGKQRYCCPKCAQRQAHRNLDARRQVETAALCPGKTPRMCLRCERVFWSKRPRAVNRICPWCTQGRRVVEELPRHGRRLWEA